MSQSHYDIIIVGAGVTGLVLAAQLAKDTHYCIALVDAKTFPDLPKGETFSPRVSALNHFSQQTLKNLKIWDKISERAGFYSKMHVWNNTEDAIDFSSDDIAQTQLGCIVENDVLRWNLLQQLSENPNITLFPSSPAVALSQETDQAILTLKNGDVLSGKLLVAADGANSWVRQQAGFELTEWDYGHMAIITHVQTERPHQNTAWQKFLPTGPLAFLPLLTKDCSSIVWSTSKEHADELMLLSDIEFCAQLSHSFERKLGNVMQAEKRFAFPLRMRHSKRYLQSNIVLIGDAAHTIHPLAGQGLNIGIQDSIELAQQLIKGSRLGTPVSTKKHLRAFERARKADNWQMILMMECLKQLFASEQRLLQHFLSIGLSLTNRSPSLKALFLRAAQGPT